MPPLRVGLGVGERERAAPGAAEHQPAVDGEGFSQGLDVGDQVLGGVVGELAQRRRAARSALVEQHDAVVGRVEEAPVVERQAGARAAVQEQGRPARRIAADLPVHDVGGVEGERARLQGLDHGIERLFAHVDASRGAWWFDVRHRPDSVMENQAAAASLARNGHQ
jgi:hypothetical protein